MVEGEAPLQLGDLIGDGVRIARVAPEYLDRDGAAVGRAEETVDDLGLALLAVPVVAALGQRATAAFDIARRHVVEHQRPALQMPLGERGFDGALTFMQPIERRVEFVLVDLAEAEFDTEAGGGGRRIERLGGGEFGGRRDDAADDHRQDEIANSIGLAVGLAGVLGSQQPVEADGARRAEHGRDVAMRQRAFDRQSLLAGGNDDAALEDAAQALDMLRRPVRQIEQRALADALAVPIALAQEDGGRRATVRDDLDIHGGMISQPPEKSTTMMTITWVHFCPYPKQMRAKSTD